jgi:hypothetical protein
MKRKILSFLFIVTASLLPLVPSRIAAADTSLHLVTAPAPLSLVGKPGQSVQAKLSIKNAGLTDELLTASTYPFGAYKDAGQPQLRDATAADTYLKWMTFSPATFTAHPNEWVEVTATISIPADAAFGYYYAVVFSRAHTDAAGAGQTGLEGGTAALVLLDVDVPGAKRTLEINQFTAPALSEFLPVDFSVSVKNTGNVHAAPRGNIFLERGGDKNVAILEVNPALGNILPNSSRVFDASWQDGTPYWADKVVDGKVLHNPDGSLDRSLSWKGLDVTKLRMGHYTATLIMTYDDGTRDVPLQATVSFWVIPWRILIGIVVIGLLVVVGIWTVISRLRRGFQNRKL